MINLESCVLSDGIKKLIPILQNCLLNKCIFSFYNLSLSKKLEKLEVFRIFFCEFEAVSQYDIHSAIYFLLNRRISYQDFNFWRVNIFPSIFFHYYYICLSGGLVSAAFHNYFNGKNYLKERFSLYYEIE